MPSKDIKIANTQNSPVRTVIKVKTVDGSFQTIIPITDSASVIGVSGRSMDLEIVDIQKILSSNTSSIQTFTDDTKDLGLNMTTLVEYVNPLMDELKSHIEVIDLGDDVDSTIFDHVYDELDTMSEKVSLMESKISDIISKLDKVIADNKNLSKIVDDLIVRVENHEDTIV